MVCCCLKVEETWLVARTCLTVKKAADFSTRKERDMLSIHSNGNEARAKMTR